MPEKSKFSRTLESCGNFIYNSEDKTILGRTFKSWALIWLFYIGFYAILGGIFVGMFMIYVECFIKPYAPGPRLTGMQSILKLAPGLLFYPQPDYTTPTLIEYNVDSKQSYSKYVDDISKRFAIYSKTDDGSCDLINNPRKYCKFDIESLGNCSTANYGYADGGDPCVFVRITKVYGWIPDTENNVSNPYITCEEEGNSRNFVKINYYPEIMMKQRNKTTEGGEIHNKYFPFLSQTGYTPPVVAVQLIKMRPNVMIKVKCSLGGLKKYSATVRFQIKKVKV